MKFWYANKIQKNDEGKDYHFGIPKVIFSIWRDSGVPYPDIKGEYGLCQEAAAIVDDVENLKLIAKAMDSERFRTIMESVVFTRGWNRKVVELFRRDFWKEFVDDDGNLLDENGAIISDGKI